MSDSLAQIALAMAGSFESSIVVKATAVVALALGGARLARRARASVRGVLLAATFGVLLALPVAALVVTPIAVEIPIAHVSASAASAVVGHDSEPGLFAAGTANNSRCRASRTRGRFVAA